MVCDGCGSSRHSEVGAKLGARLFVEALSSRIAAGKSPADPSLWQRAKNEVLAHLRIIGNAMGGSFSEVVSEYFLFTVVGAVVTPSLTAIFAIGDGLFAVNDEVQVLGPFPGNQPPYLGYELLERGGSGARSRARPHGAKLEPAFEHPAVELQLLRPTCEITSLLIATDGAVELLDCADQPLPGRAEKIGPLSQFWTSDLYFENRDALRRRLAIINRDDLAADWHNQRLVRRNGLLRDDTTIVAIRRCSAGAGSGAPRWLA